jgi:aryl-alcohol dehydrogenase-like predicted oxidoreductase
MDRAEYEGDLAALVSDRGLGVLPWWGLASGYLTGKHRLGGPAADTPRTEFVQPYVTERGERVLGVLRDIAMAHGVTPAAVALTWLGARPGVVAPISSARSVEQLMDLLAMATLHLTDDDVRALDEVSADHQVAAS